MGSLSPSLFRLSILSNLSKTLPLRHQTHHHLFYTAGKPLLRHHHRLHHHSAPVFLALDKQSTTPKRPSQRHRRSRDSNHMVGPRRSQKSAPYSTALSPAQAPESEVDADGAAGRTGLKPRSKARRDTPEGILRHRLDQCSKRGDLEEALRLYDEARAQAVCLSQHHYNVLLYLCSSPSAASEDGALETEDERPVQAAPHRLGLERGFEIFRQMDLNGIQPNEATFTSIARLAAAKEDADLAFELIKQMQALGIPPKLRSYGPALFGFCKKGDAEKAYQVEQHMADCGVLPEDAELGALVQVSSAAGGADQVYRLLHKLRALVRQVSESTAQVVENWFESDASGKVGMETWEVAKVNEGILKGGGGWHGQGWLGKGKWSVGKTEMDERGVCRRCGERLVCIDIDPSETENFAKSLSNLACQREAQADFLRFQEWLSEHGPYDAVIDGANVGLYKQSNFSFYQINSVVNGIREMSPSKRMPLIILHNRRVKGGPADSPNNKKLVESWRKSGALYATPFGSNDDWYWLYAAVSCKSLLVTNDEMRDHLFQLLGNSFFPRWKEKHQVRLTFSRRGPAFHLPPPYSIVIQESETGNWHIPTVTGDDVEAPRQWICAHRPAVVDSSLSPSIDASPTAMNDSPLIKPKALRLSSIF